MWWLVFFVVSSLSLWAGVYADLAWWLALLGAVLAGAWSAYVGADLVSVLRWRRRIQRLLKIASTFSTCSDCLTQTEVVPRPVSFDPVPHGGHWWASIGPILITFFGLCSLYSLSVPWYLVTAAGVAAATVLTYATQLAYWLATAGLSTRYWSVMDGLRDTHTWDGCQCTTCQTTRNEQHSWNGCRCERCGGTRDQDHEWDGCKCVRCGKTRRKGHKLDRCTCRVCGHTVHTWEHGRCRVCGKVCIHDIRDRTCIVCGRHFEPSDLPAAKFPSDMGATRTSQTVAAPNTGDDDPLLGLLLGSYLRVMGVSAKDLGIDQLSGMCDFCRDQCRGEVFTAQQVASAAKRGFCPSAAKRVGWSPRNWKRHATSGPASQTDWLVCSKCLEEFRPYV